MRRSRCLHALLAVAFLLGACASRSTELVNSWKEPGLTPRRFNKVLVVFITRDAGLRQAAEDHLARRLGTRAVPAYKVFPDSLLQNKELAKAWVKQQGFDGAVILHPAKVEQETTVVPGQVYAVPLSHGDMWGYWGTGYGYAYDPGYVEQDQVVSVEANVYSVAEDKLVWASRTKTYNPESVPKFVDEIVDATVAEMKKQKVIASK
ncbi:MAG TPA: hypothetical protein VNO19_01095 [Gemmatimonadales bacterium]|nr:hypothetical protein [Gemmatimonadales bacterium]